MTEENDLHIRFAEKYLEIKDREQEIKSLKSELAIMEQELLEKFAEGEFQGLNKISLKGGITLRVDCKIWPKISSPEAAIAAIKTAGLIELMARENYQAQSLAAYLRECDKNGDPLPIEFKGVIEPNPIYKIIATRH